MASTLTRGLRVTINQYDGKGCNPAPLDHGFDEGAEYECIALLDYSETSEAYMFLVNGGGEFWAIPSRSCRFARWAD